MSNNLDTDDIIGISIIFTVFLISIARTCYYYRKDKKRSQEYEMQRAIDIENAFKYNPNLEVPQ